MVVMSQSCGNGAQQPILPPGDERSGPVRGSLIHYSDRPLGRVRSTRQDVHAPGAHRSHYTKPNGLWVSVLGPRDWASWCRAESFRQTRKQYAAMIVLVPGAKVLRLTSAADLDVFTDDYGFDFVWGSAREYVDRVIDWAKVARDWHGLVIAPYVWQRRLTRRTSWYYGWDCASGCIWNARAIAGARTIRAPLSAHDTSSATDPLRDADT